ncbi:23S rRNA (uracil-5-)-methyltransferase RumA, partial [Bacillus anthracis]|nr:23S rRNA (uracil-5-)-methyltransferase RumA [Bacillus anthracis]
VKVKKNFAFGRLMKLHTESPYRKEAECPVYNQCGGCQAQNLTYEGKIQAKEKKERDVMQRIGGLGGGTVKPVLGMKKPWGYRNKTQIPIGEPEGGLVPRFYRQGKPYIINIESCLIHAEENDTLIPEGKRISEKHGISAYKE